MKSCFFTWQIRKIKKFLFQIYLSSKLNPKPSEADVFTLIKIATDSFFPLLPAVVADEKPVRQQCKHCDTI